MSAQRGWPGPRPKTRRQWGWHRLEPEWAARVVAGSAISAGDLVLDLGAGTGALTAPLAATGVRVIAVEYDEGRARVLRQRFDGVEVRVVQTDLHRFRLPRRPFRVVASPPYSASTALLRLLLSTDRLWSADLVLQRAAATRLVEVPPGARHGRLYDLSVGMAVPRRAFSPAPKVDSVVLRVRRRDRRRW